MTAEHHHSNTLQERLEASSRRIDETARDMLSVLEDEIQESECDALERAFHARHTHLHSDDDW
ncbi:MAG TPA: hypothetical protein VMV45_11325 [Casimicrobiaceae bacterium]|nr:hypothetical protein [Casimicrobiaceae bacterium]